ncbi:kelch-like protein 4 isoform X2 [Xenia sp. Carnegie-2017]|uniref:kelch-like protein 4 isoform X2 n=1 Tax=Xenia sp. Carnegie-2017 TaxID=2897299 RepID=UPI001F03DAF7|nr:kelch-like protein 4 isoform X2 [Xenia sp. Carnegie-2017]
MATNDSYGGYEQERFLDKVHPRFECPICFKIIKDPLQCPNQHHFCRSCIEKCLLSSNKCPQCNCPITSETLQDVPRIVTEMLEDHDIRCKNVNRGCPEIMKLQFLERHEKNCGYSPTLCRNKGCDEVLNENEIEEHERERCEFRLIDCEECKMMLVFRYRRSHSCFLRKEIDELTKRLDMFEKSQNDRSKHVEEQVRLNRNEMVTHVEEQMKLNRDEMVKHVEEQVTLNHNEMTFLTTETTERYNFLTGKVKIFVCGGRDGENRLNFVESFNWNSNCWQQEPKMNEERSAATAFVYGREIFVCGGWNGKQQFGNIESLNVDGKLQWKISPVMLPRKCHGHSMIYHNDNVIMIGGHDNNETFDTIYSIQLNPPHTTKLLAQIPELRRYHGSIIIEDDVLVFGGATSEKWKDIKNTVYSYSLSKNECKTLAPLPYPVRAMAIVSYKGNVILIGGVNEKGEYLDKVLMYDVKTGQTKILPSLNHKRCGCSAVIIGNIIVVVGGYDKESYLDSIECLDMSTNVWRELPPMLTKRSFPAAIVSPIY